MHLLSNCQLESSSSSSCTMFMSRCHKTVSKLSKHSSNCSKVGLLLSSQSTSVTLKWVTAKAGYGQWLELGSKKIVSQPIGNYQIPEGWSFLEVEPLLISPGVRVFVISQSKKIFEPLVPWAFSFLSSSATSRCDLGCGSFSAASAWTSKF